MSTPTDPQRGGQPPEKDPAGGSSEHPESAQPSDAAQPPANPYAQPPGQQQYGAGQYGQYGAGPYGSSPPYNPYGQQYGGQQYGAQPQYGQAAPYGQQQPGYGQQPGPYGSQPYSYPNQPAYNPYGSPSYPAGLDEGGVGAVARPTTVTVALVLLILSTLPFLLAGVAAAVIASPNLFPPEILSDPRIAGQGITPDLLVSAIRAGALIALLYVLFAVQAFRGRNWARIMVAVMTVGFTLLLLLGLFGGTATGDAGGLIFLALILVGSVGGMVLLFLPDSSRYFANPRR